MDHSVFTMLELNNHPTVPVIPSAWGWQTAKAMARMPMVDSDMLLTNAFWGLKQTGLII